MSISALAVRGTKVGVNKVMGIVGSPEFCDIKLSSSQSEQNMSDSSPVDLDGGFHSGLRMERIPDR